MRDGSRFARLTLNAGARAEDNAAFGTRVVASRGRFLCLAHCARRVSATRACALPTDRESSNPGSIRSYGTDPCFPGNPNLLPEQSRTIHAGFEQKLASDRVRFSADYFDSRFHNIVSFLSVAPSAACLAVGAPFGAGTISTPTWRARAVRIFPAKRASRAGSAPAQITPTIPRARFPRRPIHRTSIPTI